MFSQIPGHTQNRHLNSKRTQCAAALPSLSLSCHQLDLTNQLRNPFIRIPCICSEKTDKCKKTETNNNCTSLFYNPIMFCFNFVCFLWDSGRLKTDLDWYFGIKSRKMRLKLFVLINCTSRCRNLTLLDVDNKISVF